MIFDYVKQPSQIHPSHPWIPRPIIPVRLFHKAVDLDVYALIDSGADASLFDAQVAQDLLIDLEAGRKQTLYGVSGHPIEVYFHKIKLQIIGSKESIELEVGFTDATAYTALLGQVDFFMHYQITFERAKERIKITPAKP